MNQESSYFDWNIIFNGLSAISTFFLLVCTIIGFWFVNKQIKIEKNKDILFSFQKDITSYLHQIYRNNLELREQLVNMLNDFSIPNNIDMSDNKHKKLKKNEITKLLNEMIKFCDNFDISYFSKIKYYLTNYDWWLSIHTKDFDKILHGESFYELYKFPHAYILDIKNLKEKYDNELSSLSYNIITSEVKKVINENHYRFVDQLNAENTKMNDFLAKLAKYKGVS